MAAAISLRADFGAVDLGALARQCRRLLALAAVAEGSNRAEAAENQEGYREVLGIGEGAKEDKAGWSAFLIQSSQDGFALKRIRNDSNRRALSARRSHYAARRVPEATSQAREL